MRKFRFITENGKNKKKYSGKEDSIRPENINDARIQMISNKELIIDGCQSVVEYNDTLLTLRVNKGTVSVFGNQLNIASFDEAVITVKGVITSIEFNL